MPTLAAVLASTQFRGLIVTLVGMGAIAFKSKLGIEIDATSQECLVAMVVAFLGKLIHENHVDNKAQAAATLTTPAAVQAPVVEALPPGAAVPAAPGVVNPAG